MSLALIFIIIWQHSGRFYTVRVEPGSSFILSLISNIFYNPCSSEAAQDMISLYFSSHPLWELHIFPRHLLLFRPLIRTVAVFTWQWEKSIEAASPLGESLHSTCFLLLSASSLFFFSALMLLCCTFTQCQLCLEIRTCCSFPPLISLVKKWGVF